MGEKIYYILHENPFFKGFARIINLDGVLSDDYMVSKEENDSKFIYEDWLMVGKDIKKAIEKYEQETTHAG